MKVLVIFGTRPETIKMCPLVLELRNRENINCKVCLTGQHRDMVRPVLECFKIKEDYDLDIMKQNQTLTSITSDILQKLEGILENEQPDIVLVHGDTTTSFAAALASFYQKIPIGHVEAGLRTYNKYSPFPEEMNRTLTGKIASLHFAPTEQNRLNLQKEGITENVFVTGNTVIDSFKTTVIEKYNFRNSDLRKVDFDAKKVIVLTAHRRENIGKNLENICKAVKQLVNNNEDIIVVYPVHPNPLVKQTVYEKLGNCERVLLTNPIDVLDMHNLIAKSYMVMTDSGGLQEEAPALGKPVLVLRTETERPEAILAGTAKLAGVDASVIVECAELLLHNDKEYKKMAKAVNPYGDGNASKYIADYILRWGNESACGRR